MRVTSSPIRAIVTLTTAGPDSGGHVTRGIVGARREQRFASVWSLAALPQLREDELERVQRRALLAGDTRIAITDVQPAEGRIMSERPFALRISFVAGDAAEAALVSVAVHWAGRPFVVEKRVSAREVRAGRVDVRFPPSQALPTGPATFAISLLGRQGAQAVFRTSCAVLPSNPFSLSVSPDVDYVTGTFSARSVRRGGSFETHVRMRLSNGDGAAVSLDPSFQWTFWDGGVGGSLVEHGSGSFGGNDPSSGSMCSEKKSARHPRESTFTSPPSVTVWFGLCEAGSTHRARRPALCREERHARREHLYFASERHGLVRIM
jgi:hypothetical protein